jgi:hypothetical protein
MGRRRRVALVVAACVVVLGIVAWFAWPRDEPTRTTVGDAVRTFRAEGHGGKEANGSGEAALGVYRYGTRGGESVNSSVLDTTHDYNGTSTIVLSAGRCAERERWQVLDGRWSEGELCTAHGKTTGTVTEFHEFFGVGQKDVFHCHSDTASAKVGASLSSFCESDNSSISTTSHVLAPEKVYVGGLAFDATPVESRSVFGGADSGSALRREWRRRSDGLLLRRMVRSEADTSAAGGTHYSERYTIKLLSTEPKR